MNPLGNTIRGSSVPILEQYLLDNFPLYDNLTAHEVGMITDYAGGGGNKQILDVKITGHQGVSKAEEGLKRYVLMTRHGSAVCAAPQQKLQDALMSLNFLIAEEAFQSFSEVREEITAEEENIE
jgi:hypothetical protein